MFPTVVQRVVVDGRITGGAGGGMYCWPTNLNSGILPSEGPHAYVIEYHVTGPGITSARMPPALLWLERTRYVPIGEQLSDAVAKHFAGSDVHLTFLIDSPVGDLNSLTLGVAQPRISVVDSARQMVFIGF